MQAIMAEPSPIHAGLSLDERLSELVLDQYPFGVDAATVEYYAKGSNNLVYLCQDVPERLSGVGAFVMRVPMRAEGAEALEADYVNRMELQGLCMPRVLGLGRLSCCNVPVMFEEFVEGEHKEFDALTHREIGVLARAVAKVHSRTSDRYSGKSGEQPALVGTYRDYILAMVDESVDKRLETISLDRYRGANLAIARGKMMLNGLLVTQEELFSGNRFSLLHHDLNPGNARWRSGNVTLFDPNFTWGDPADDLDYLYTNNCTRPGFRTALWDAYRSAVGAGMAGPVIARVPAYTLKNRLDDLAWTISMCEEYKTDPAKAKFYRKAYRQRLKALQALVA